MSRKISDNELENVAGGHPKHYGAVTHITCPHCNATLVKKSAHQYTTSNGCGETNYDHYKCSKCNHEWDVERD